MCQRCQRRLSVSHGFTAIEMMVTLAIAAILMTIAAPNFSTFIAQTRLTSAANDFFSAINATRSEALSRGRRIDMVPADGVKWTSGWKVFVDGNNDQVPGGGELVIMEHGSLSTDIIVDGGGSGTAFFDGSKTYISYSGAGYAQRNSGANLADSMQLRNKTVKRKIVISFLGRPRVCNPDLDKSC